MILTQELLKTIKKNKINFFSGVPDSILKNLSNKLDRFSKKNHIIAANEGSAVSIGIGYHLSTKKIPCVYLQNSGLGNAINPLISIAHNKVYSIPLLLIIGWRGSFRHKDEPQHKVKGEITPNLLKLLNIKYCVLRKKKDLKKLNFLIKESHKKNKIVACLIEKNTLFDKNKKIQNKNITNQIARKDFIFKLLENISNKSKIISTTGYTSRELMQIRNEKKIFKGKDFYMVGGMGHTSSVALGYSIFSKNETICIDGDGSLLMHLGSIKTVGSFAKKNFKYILLNNNTHDSVGGQNTFANNVNFKTLSKSLGFKKYYCIEKYQNMKKQIHNFLTSKSLTFLEVRIANNKIKQLPRPKDLISVKKLFMQK